MRSIKLVSALAAAASLLAATAAGASARPAGSGACRVSVSVSASVVTAGETVQFAGTPHCPSGASTAVVPISVFQHEDVTTPSLKLLTTLTSAPFSVTSNPLSYDSTFYAVISGRHSVSRKVRVGPQVTLAGPTGVADGSVLLTGRNNAVRFTGTVNPTAGDNGDNGAVAVLEREEATANEEWHQIQFTHVQAGAFAFLHAFGAPGAANLRVLVRPHGPFGARGISNALSFEISQPQNPKLTISASPDPATYLQPVTISGVVAGVTSPTVVNLLGTIHNGAGFKAMAPATVTDSSGKYTFTVPAVQNTSYRVETATVKSAILFEGVKQVLSVLPASLPPATMLGGQTFTLTGTVTPAQPGHPVDLERENLFLKGFHTIDVVTEQAGGAFSIPYTVSASSKPETFRVRAPGDAQLQPISSAPFSITVNAAPLGPVLPVAPITLPH